jgi:hypothetical protein
MFTSMRKGQEAGGAGKLVGDRGERLKSIGFNFN